MIRRRGEAGYALIAAVASILIFALLALGQVTGMRAAVISGEAEIDAARAAAAADAGMAIAISHLTDPDDRRRWFADGRLRRAQFDRAALTIRIDDERGKVPINVIALNAADTNEPDPRQLTRMLELAGLEGQALRIARDSLIDWVDDDDDPQPDGAESAYYAPRGYGPRNGTLATVGELRRVRGFSPRLVEQLAAFTTVNFASRALAFGSSARYAGGSFEPRFAQPRAIDVMLGGDGGPAAIARQRELAGQTTALGFSDAAQLVGRPLGIHIVAELPDGARAERVFIVELTGTETRPYIIRAFE